MSRFTGTRRSIERFIWVTTQVFTGDGSEIVPIWLRDDEDAKDRSAYRDFFELHAIVNIGREFWRDVGIENNTVAKIILFAPWAFAVYWFFIR